MVKPWVVIENRSKIDIGRLLNFAGSLAIFIEANYLSEEQWGQIPIKFNSALFVLRQKSL
jgi:hypothetical protein